MVNIPSTAQDLATHYTTNGKYLGLAFNEPTVEVNMGEYQRVPVSWNTGSGGVITAQQVVFENLPMGTYGYLLLCQGQQRGSDDILDYCTINVTLNDNGDAGGQITVDVSYTQT